MVTTDRRAESRILRPADPPWVKALLLAPAVLGSLGTLILLGRSRSVRQRFARLLGRPTAAADLDAVRASILGLGPRRVTALYGPPPAATSAPTVTWYYRLPTAGRTAMAVSFDGDRAVRVEFFTAP